MTSKKILAYNISKYIDFKCDDEDSICVRKGKASRWRWETGASKETENITSEQSEPKATSSSGRDSAVTGDHITPRNQRNVCCNRWLTMRGFVLLQDGAFFRE